MAIEVVDELPTTESDGNPVSLRTYLGEINSNAISIPAFWNNYPNVLSPRRVLKGHPKEIRHFKVILRNVNLLEKILQERNGVNDDEFSEDLEDDE